jgi:hypothetical protein
LVHGVAFLCGISTPSLLAQGGQRRFSYFNIKRDNSGSVTDYEIEAKNSPPNGTPPQLLFFDWVWWSREYISNYFSIG